jgi:hypothetical protein
LALREGQTNLGISQQEPQDNPARAVQAQIKGIKSSFTRRGFVHSLFLFSIGSEMGIGLSELIEKWGRGLGVGQWNSRLLPSGSLAKIEVPSGSSDSWNEAEFNERFSRFSPPSRRRVTVSLRGEVLVGSETSTIVPFQTVSSFLVTDVWTPLRLQSSKVPKASYRVIRYMSPALVELFGIGLCTRWARDFGMKFPPKHFSYYQTEEIEVRLPSLALSDAVQLLPRIVSRLPLAPYSLS